MRKGLHLVDVKDAAAEGHHHDPARLVVVESRQPGAALIEEVLLRKLPPSLCIIHPFVR